MQTVGETRCYVTQQNTGNMILLPHCVKIAVAERKPEMWNWSDRPKGWIARNWLWKRLFLDAGGGFERCMSNNRKWYNDIQKQSSRAKVKEKTSTDSYWQMKQEWEEEIYIAQTGLLWVRMGILNLRCIRRGVEEGRYPLCNEEDKMIHICY